MTYLESAENLEIDHKRALAELKKHGLLNGAILEQFYQELGMKNQYSATKVLNFIGY